MIPKLRLYKIKNFYAIFFDNIKVLSKNTINYKLTLRLYFLDLHPGKSN
jgi:hypothetical protein